MTTPTQIYIIEVTRGQWSPAKVELEIMKAARWDGYETSIRLPKDPGGAGKFQAAYLVGKLSGWTVHHRSPRVGDKVTRADPFARAMRTRLRQAGRGPPGTKPSSMSCVRSLTAPLTTRSMRQRPRSVD